MKASEQSTNCVGTRSTFVGQDCTNSPAIRITHHALVRYSERAKRFFVKQSFHMEPDLKTCRMIRHLVRNGRRILTDEKGCHHILSEVIDTEGRVATILFIMDPKMRTVITCKRASICK